MKPRTGTIKEAYKSLPYIHEPKHTLHTEYSEFMKVILCFNNKFAEHLITTGKQETLPHRLGRIQIVKFKPTKTKAIDFKATKDVFGEHNSKIDSGEIEGKKKIVYHKNWHTGGYAVRLGWDKKGFANFKNKKLWALSFTISHRRLNQNSIAKYVKRNGVDYLLWRS